MRTAVIAIAKLENNYICEWVEHYKHLGFTNVIIYDNNNPDGERFDSVIGEYIDDGFAIIEDFRGKYPGAAQSYAYQDGYDKYGKKYDWIAFFDIDEFLILNERFENNISNYLSMGCFGGKDLIRVSWREYGDNGLVRVENGDYSLVNRFKAPLENQRKWTKAIVRGGIENFKVPQKGDGQAHLVRISEIHHAVDANGISIKNDTIRNGCGYELAALNHYSTKTIEEFALNKKKKGYCEGTDPKILNLEYFFSANEKTQEKVDLYNKLTSANKKANVVCKDPNEIFYILFGRTHGTVYSSSRFDLQGAVDRNKNGRFIDMRILDVSYYDGWRDNEHHITTKTYYNVICPFFSYFIKTFKFRRDDFIDVPFFTADFKHDVSYLKPKKHFTFSMDMNGVNLGNGLTFDQITNINWVNEDAKYLTEYHRLFRGTHSCCVVTNETIENDYRIFISGDSMMVPMIPIFCCYYKEVVYMDNRDGKSHRDYFNEKTFDEVLLCFYDG